MNAVQVDISHSDIFEYFFGQMHTVLLKIETGRRRICSWYIWKSSPLLLVFFFMSFFFFFGRGLSPSCSNKHSVTANSHIMNQAFSGFSCLAQAPFYNDNRLEMIQKEVAYQTCVGSSRTTRHNKIHKSDIKTHSRYDLNNYDGGSPSCTKTIFWKITKTHILTNVVSTWHSSSCQVNDVTVRSPGRPRLLSVLWCHWSVWCHSAGWTWTSCFSFWHSSDVWAC